MRSSQGGKQQEAVEDVVGQGGDLVDMQFTLDVSGDETSRGLVIEE